MSDYTTLIATHAAQYGISPDLVAAIIMQESAGNPWAIRYEPAFHRRYIADTHRLDLPGHVPAFLPTLETEKQARSTSWGLMQMMGNTARITGFDAPYLSQLLEPSVSIYWGCRYLARLLSQTGQAEDAALLRWNGGGDKLYPSRVRKHIASGAIANVYNPVAAKGKAG